MANPLIGNLVRSVPFLHMNASLTKFTALRIHQCWPVFSAFCVMIEPLEASLLRLNFGGFLISSILWKCDMDANLLINLQHTFVCTGRKERAIKPRKRYVYKNCKMVPFSENVVSRALHRPSSPKWSLSSVSSLGGLGLNSKFKATSGHTGACVSISTFLVKAVEVYLLQNRGASQSESAARWWS